MCLSLLMVRTAGAKTWKTILICFTFGFFFPHFKGTVCLSECEKLNDEKSKIFECHHTSPLKISILLLSTTFRRLCPLTTLLLVSPFQLCFLKYEWPFHIYLLFLRRWRVVATRRWAGRSRGINFNYTCQCQGYGMANGRSDWFTVNKEGEGGRVAVMEVSVATSSGPFITWEAAGIKAAVRDFDLEWELQHTHTHTRWHNTQFHTILQLA